MSKAVVSECFREQDQGQGGVACVSPYDALYMPFTQRESLRVARMYAQDRAMVLPSSKQSENQDKNNTSTSTSIEEIHLRLDHTSPLGMPYFMGLIAGRMVVGYFGMCIGRNDKLGHYCECIFAR